uniref:Uncharacterized protein n=1 Tax=Rhizophora mucronata TaxID=61149 RepID=A0A2P2R2Y6_RHIMU
MSLSSYLNLGNLGTLFKGDNQFLTQLE